MKPTYSDARKLVWYEPQTHFDFVLGNPPFHLRWIMPDATVMASHQYYCLKAAKLLKPLGILAVIVPASFLADSFSDKGAIRMMESRFSFLGQVMLPDNAFSDSGVDGFPTKLQFWQKKSTAADWAPKRYSTDCADIYIPSGYPVMAATALYEKFVMVAKAELAGNRNRVFLELAQLKTTKRTFLYDGKEKKIGKEDTIGQFRWPGGTESDPNLMFRAGKTDRFTLGIEGISQLLRVTLQARSRTVTTWNIEGMYVSLAGNGGRRLINAANEYQWEYEKDPEKLCSSTNGDDRPYSLQLPLNQVQEIEIDFTENNIEWADSVKGQISSVTSRLPRSADDSLNVYVYLQESDDAPASLSGITMEAGAQYSRVYGGFSRVEQTLVAGENNGRKMFYGLGVPASGIDALNRLDLLAYFNNLNESGMVVEIPPGAEW